MSSLAAVDERAAAQAWAEEHVGAQLVNAVLAASATCAHAGMECFVHFTRIRPLSVEFVMHGETLGDRQFSLRLADQLGTTAKLVRLSPLQENGSPSADAFDIALTNALPEALRDTVGAFNAQGGRAPAATHDAPASLQ